MPDPTPEQQAGLDWLMAQVEAGVPLLSLQGLAGTGKTTVIPHLLQRLRDKGYPVTLAAPTHRAAFVLKSKGLSEADSVHRAALMPYFTAEYAAAVLWLGGQAVTREGLYHLAEAMDDTHVPVLMARRLAELGGKPTAAELLRDSESYPAEAILASIGLRTTDYFDGFGPKLAMEGVLVVDEGSMVGLEMLSMCQEVFDTIILIGDPGQLPPVKDTPVLHTAPAFHLTAIHRQAQDSPIVRLAYRVREGFPFWKAAVTAYGPAVQVAPSYPARQALQGPLLVWKNTSRLESTRLIRATLGYPPDRPMPGEPLICRATDHAKRLAGFYNNASFRVLATEGDDGRLMTLQDDLSADIVQAQAHLEEIDGANIPSWTIPFRFGYCLTAHTAQGGEWPQVAISLPDARSFVGMCWHTDRMEDVPRWGYTAMTRAKERLILLTNHHFV
jgi:exodeoxyribonuclease-5